MKTKELPMGPTEIHHLSMALKKLSFFSGMTLADLERVMAITRLFEYKPDCVVFRKNDLGDALYVVHTGRVRISNRRFFFGPQKNIATLSPGDVFGEMALLEQPRRTANAFTDGPTQLFVLLSTHFNDILRKNPEFSRELQKMAAQRAFDTRHLT